MTAPTYSEERYRFLVAEAQRGMDMADTRKYPDWHLYRDRYRGREPGRANYEGNTPSSAEAVPDSPTPGSAHVTTLADVKPERVRWLWEGRIPFGKLTVIEGHPGTGKSTLTVELAACVSTGIPLSGGPELDGPRDVVLLTAEDGLADTVRPRLEAAGGDAGRVHAIEGVYEIDGSLTFPGFPDDLGALSETVKRLTASLVIVDPLSAYLGAAVNSWKDSDVRRALAPLAKLAEMTGAAVVVVRHLTKQTAQAAITAGGGSIGIIGAARSGLLVATDPDDADRRVLAVVKSNLAKRAESLAFRLVDDGKGWARVKWDGGSTHTADGLIASAVGVEEKSAVAEAAEMLSEWLRDGPLGSQEVGRLSREASISGATLRRARAQLGIVPVKVGAGRGSSWVLALPDTSSPPSCSSEHLRKKEGVSDMPDNGLEDAQPPLSTFESVQGEHLHFDAVLRCLDPLCNGVQWRRKSGLVRCRVCSPERPGDPYVSPALEAAA